jgi:hypothetical protein
MTYEGVEVQVHKFLTSAPDGDGGPVFALVTSSVHNSSHYSLDMRLCRPHGWSGLAVSRENSIRCGHSNGLCFILRVAAMGSNFCIILV